MLKLTFNEDNTIASFEENKEKKASMLLTAGFFASKTLGVDFDPLQAKNNYGMRDEQEKCFALQKGPLGQDRLRTWSEERATTARNLKSLGVPVETISKATGLSVEQIAEL